MFTGIIEEIGKIKSVKRGSKSVVLEVEARKVLADTRIGDSIATNGVCLTVVGKGNDGFSADVMPETMNRSNLGLLKPGDPVNLERALCLNSRLGGHLVAGHVDGTGKIVSKQQDENAIWLTVGAAPEILRYIVEKGSVAIDGVSLTIAYADEQVFKVSVIPHTQEETTLVKKEIGDVVNLENDMIVKYVEKLIERNTKETQIRLQLNIDGTGSSDIDTGIGFFDHMLDGFTRHGLYDLTLRVHGDLNVDDHHTIEDTGIVLGNAIREAVGDKKGIKRYGSCILPMDEVLVLCAVDLSGRPYLGWDAAFSTEKIGDMATEMVKEFFYAVSYSAAMNLHIKVLSGGNSHHVAEAMFKSFAKALDAATQYDSRITDVLSTKGSL